MTLFYEASKLSRHCEKIETCSAYWLTITDDIVMIFELPDIMDTCPNYFSATEYLPMVEKEHMPHENHMQFYKEKSIPVGTLMLLVFNTIYKMCI